ncbi:MAG TPA: hypothetical protein PLS10_09600 [Chitinophagales bacterium]|nr:hypothetical protein [Chitinophagales bacterium]
MQKIIILLLSVLIFTACESDKKTIEFKKMANLDLGNLSKGNATIKATAVFMNLSEEEYNLKDMVLDFTIDGKDVGTIVTKTDKIIKPKSEFSIPVQYSYETSSFVEEGHEPSSTYAVQLLGDLTLKNSKGEEVTAAVKYATTYEYLTKKEIRLDKREERKKRRQEKKAAKNN